MRLCQGQTSVRAGEIGLLLRDVADEYTAANVQPGLAVVVQRTVKREIACLGELPFLMDRAEWRFERFGIGSVPLREVESRRDASVPAQAEVRVAGEANADLSPGGRDDRGLDEIALDAKVVGRLVRFVQVAQRDQIKTRLDRQAIIDLMLDVRLFDRDFALIVS